MARLPYRKYAIESESGDKLDLADGSTRIWAYQPTDFGANYDNDIVETEFGIFKLIKSKRKANTPTLTLNCESYEAYEDFADKFINSGFGLKLYRYTTTEHLNIHPNADIVFNSIVHSEVSEDGRYYVELGFTQLTPWRFRKKILSIASASGMAIPMVIDDSDEDGLKGWNIEAGVDNKYVINNPTNKEIPCKLTYIGAVTNPSFEIQTKYNRMEYYNIGTIEYSTEDPLSKVIVNAIPDSYITINGENAEDSQSENKFNYMLLPPKESTIILTGVDSQKFEIEIEVLKDDF